MVRGGLSGGERCCERKVERYQETLSRIPVKPIDSGLAGMPRGWAQAWQQ